MNKRINTAFPAAVILGLAPALSSQADELTVDRIADTIIQSRQDLTSLRIELRFTPDPHVSARQLKTTLGKIFVRNGSEEIVFADGGRRRMTIAEHTPVEMVGKDGVKEKATIPTETISVFDGDRLLQKTGETGLVMSKDSFPSTSAAFNSLYLREIGWYLSDPVASDQVNTHLRRFAVPESFSARPFRIVSEDADNGLVELHSEMKALDDSNSIGTETLILDGQKNFCFVRRELRRNGNLITRTSAGRHVEVAPGLWLPSEVAVDEYDWKTRNETSLVTTHMTVSFSDYNAVNPAAFSIEFKPGTPIGDFAEGARRGLPEGKPVLKTVAADGEFIDQAIANRVDYQTGRMRWIVIISAVAIGTFSLLFYLKRSEVQGP